MLFLRRWIALLTHNEEMQQTRTENQSRDALNRPGRSVHFSRNVTSSQRYHAAT